MNTHTSRLHREPFEAIASGKKTIESRLFDKKRQTIALNDTIIYTDRSNPSNTVKVKVIGLLRYADFEVMFRNNPSYKFGEENLDQLLNSIQEYYSPEDQRHYGVIGIEFELL